VDIAALREEFNQLKKQNCDLLTAVATAKRKFTAEETQQKEARFARMDEIKALLDDAKRLAETTYAEGNAQLAADPAQRVTQPSAAATFSLANFKRDANLYCRTGQVVPGLQNAQFGTDTTTQGGIFLPVEVAQPVEVRRNQNAFYALLDWYKIKPMSILTPRQVNLPVTDDRSVVGQQQTQSATSGTSADPSFTASLTLNGSQLYSSKQIWLSNTLVLAQDFDVIGYALPILQKRVLKAKESAWTTKLAALTPGYTTKVLAGMTYADVIAWEHSLYASYRADMGYVVADTLYQTLRSITDNYGRPILDEHPETLFAATIHGKPVIVSDYLTAYGANAISGALISAEGGQKILDVVGDRLARYIQVPTNPDQTGFEIFSNGDANFIAAGISVLKIAGS